MTPRRRIVEIHTMPNDEQWYILDCGHRAKCLPSFKRDVGESRRCRQCVGETQEMKGARENQGVPQTTAMIALGWRSPTEWRFRDQP